MVVVLPDPFRGIEARRNSSGYSTVELVWIRDQNGCSAKENTPELTPSSKSTLIQDFMISFRELFDTEPLELVNFGKL